MSNAALLVEKTIRALEARQFRVLRYPNRVSALAGILSLLPDGARIGWGGSHTISEMGLIDALHQGTYVCLNRAQAKTQAEKDAIYAQIQNADYFLTSTNAITSDGELVNMDGRSDRVSFLCFGPKQVIVICGTNKLVMHMDDALQRIREVAAPLNARALNRQVPCAVTGKCTDCRSPQCLCCNLVISRFCRTPGRMTVVLIDEDLGF